MWKKKKLKNSPWKDKLAGKIAAGVITIQLEVAAQLSRWTNKTAYPHRKIILYLLFVGIGGYYTYLLADALFRKRAPPPLLILPLRNKPDTSSVNDVHAVTADSIHLH